MIVALAVPVALFVLAHLVAWRLRVLDQKRAMPWHPAPVALNGNAAPAEVAPPQTDTLAVNDKPERLGDWRVVDLGRPDGGCVAEFARTSSTWPLYWVKVGDCYDHPREIAQERWKRGFPHSPVVFLNPKHAAKAAREAAEIEAAETPVRPPGVVRFGA